MCCPVCNTAMRSREDESSWYEFNCCNRCTISWAAARKSEWDSGWRPDPQALREEIGQRLPITVKIDIA